MRLFARPGWHWPGLLLGLTTCVTDSSAPRDPAAELNQLLVQAVAGPVLPIPRAADPLVRLGQALFFDKVLSGDRNIGCSTCHNPGYHTSDNLELSIGTGGQRPGASRQLGSGQFTLRHSSDLFDRGQPAWRELMWDGRVEQGSGGPRALTGAELPAGLSGVLAAQALLPMASRIEMRGAGLNEVAALPDTAYQAIYDALAARLRALPGYDSLFQAAYPGLPSDSLNISRAANAIAAFIGSTWQTGGTPFDRYLLGDTAALTEPARRGALLFFGRAGCSKCHRGDLLTDQAFHNTGIPVLLSDGLPDLGRASLTGQDGDRYRFRTPPLRNVSLTPPFMHNGSLRTLAEVVAHYANPVESLRSFDPSRLDPRLQSALDLSPARLDDVVAHLDSNLVATRPLDSQDQADLVSFLRALTDPASSILLDDIPRAVPSGLPVFDH